MHHSGVHSLSRVMFQNKVSLSYYGLEAYEKYLTWRKSLFLSSLLDIFGKKKKKKYKQLDWFLWKCLKPIQCWTETENEKFKPQRFFFFFFEKVINDCDLELKCHFQAWQYHHNHNATLTHVVQSCSDNRKTNSDFNWPAASYPFREFVTQTQNR